MNWLTEQQVIQLTKRKRPSAQLRQLESLGMLDLVRYRTDGTFIVLCADSEQTGQPDKKYELDFSGFGNGSQAA